MASPEVWAAARSIIEDRAASLGIQVNWPNEYGAEPEAAPDGALPLWAAVEIEADGAAPYEIGGSTWQETGRVSVHVFSPTGSGIAAGLAARKAFADAFRGRPPGPLLWDDFAFPAGGSDQAEGNWYRQSLGVGYRFTDA